MSDNQPMDDDDYAFASAKQNPMTNDSATVDEGLLTANDALEELSAAMLRL